MKDPGRQSIDCLFTELFQFVVVTIKRKHPAFGTSRFASGAHLKTARSECGIREIWREIQILAFSRLHACFLSFHLSVWMCALQSVAARIFPNFQLFKESIAVPAARKRPVSEMLASVSANGNLSGGAARSGGWLVVFVCPCQKPFSAQDRWAQL